MRRLAFAALVPLLLTPISAGAQEAMTDAEREAFRAEVRAYLLDNPEVLMEAIAVLEQREAEAAAIADQAMVAANAAALFEAEDAFVMGNPDGDITVVEFLDYRCGFCRRAHPEVAALLEADDNIRVIIKEFPVLGEQSVLAARFALAVRAVEGDAAYKEAGDTLMTMRADVTEASLRDVAQAFDWDADAIFAETDSDAITETLTEARALAQALQITGTPTFVVENQMVRGYVPLAQMQAIIEDIRASEG